MKITTSLQLQAELRGQLWLTAGVLFHFASLFLLSLFGFFNVLKLPTLSLRVHVQLALWRLVAHGTVPVLGLCPTELSFVYYMCMYVCIPCVCQVRPQRAEEGVRSPGTGVVDGCKVPCEC